ncbi:MAG: gamma-glutamyltransferase [Halioglobus sp.]|nr:gamma-glutamyltransferase [Halioglobus sp.]
MELAQRLLVLLCLGGLSLSCTASTTQREGSPLPSAQSQSAPIINYSQRFLPAMGRGGMVVGPEEIAVETGLAILRQGGNAIDAAVATGFALAVTYPRAGNLGGGGFMLIHLAKDNRQTFIDYRETAPAAATRDLFLDDEGEVDRRREYFSLQSAGVPGTVAGLLYAQRKYGKLTREEVLAPAIALARDGIPVSITLNLDINSRATQLGADAEATRLFLPGNGRAPAVGSTWKQPDLARTLAHISERGRDGFYRGPVAGLIAQAMKAGDGLITLQDLADYRAVEREPVRGQYRGFEVVSAPPPSSGGIHIVQMLNILEGFDLRAMGHNSAAYLHHLAEAMKLAYADRSEYLGDPDFVTVPTGKLIDKGYATRQRALIDSARATSAQTIAPGRVMHEGGSETTHFSVADSDGNVVSNTYTLNFSFGSHIAVPGTGMLLNNEMADFAARPGMPNAYGLVQGEANRIEPGKRPLSSMSPTLVLLEGRPWLATGSPGGSIIINTVLQTILNAMEFDMNVAAAASEPRVHHQWMPDRLLTEQGISPDTLKLLEAMGQPVVKSERTQGRTNSIMLRDGWMFGATDPRRPGGWVAAY